MNHTVSQKMDVIAVLLLTYLFVLPVSGDFNADAKPFISALVSS